MIDLNRISTRLTSPPEKKARPTSKAREVYDFLSGIFLLLFFICMLMSRGIEGTGADAFNLLCFMGAELVAFAGMLYICGARKVALPIPLLVCRFAWGPAAGLVLLFTAHCARFGSLAEGLRAAAVLFLCQSPWWPDQLLAATLFSFSLTCALLTLISKRTRKRALRMILPWIALIIVGSIGLTEVRENDRPLGLLLGSLILFSWPLWNGYHALRFEREYGAELRSELTARLQAKQASTPIAPKRPFAPTAPAARPVHNPAPAASKPKPASTASKSAPESAAAAQPPSVDQQAQKLAREKAAYEMRLRDQAAQAQEDPSQSLLPEVAKRLFPSGATLATLGGQRQLLVWLLEGVPGLAPLEYEESARALMQPNLADELERFVPLLEALSEKAAALLEAHIYDDDPQWLSLTPEALARGWFALRMYARMGQNSDLFELSALEVSRRVSKRQDALDWLHNNA